MNETPDTRMAELLNAMVGAHETWVEPLSARLAQVALRRTTVSAGDCVLDIGAGTGALSVQAAALGARVTFDQTLSLQKVGGRIRGSLEYATAL